MRHAAWLPGALTFGGVEIRVAAHIDDVEIARRGGEAQAISREVLEGLFVLPEHGAALESDVPSWAARVLDVAPEWAVVRHADGWLRTYRPPAHIACVSVADWTMAVDVQLEQLEWVMPVAPTVVVTSLEEGLRMLDLVTNRTVGIAVAEGENEMWMLAPPRPWRVRLTSQRWWLAECVAALSGSAGEPNATPWPSGRG